MELSRKKKCVGCRALLYSCTKQEHCSLGFKTKLGEYQMFLYPTEMCYKPKTKAELIKAKELTNGK